MKLFLCIVSLIFISLSPPHHSDLCVTRADLCSSKEKAITPLHYITTHSLYSWGSSKESFFTFILVPLFYGTFIYHRFKFLGPKGPVQPTCPLFGTKKKERVLLSSTVTHASDRRVLYLLSIQDSCSLVKQSFLVI